MLRPGQCISSDNQGAPILVAELNGGQSWPATVVMVDWENDKDVETLRSSHQLFRNT